MNLLNKGQEFPGACLFKTYSFIQMIIFHVSKIQLRSDDNIGLCSLAAPAWYLT